MELHDESMIETSDGIQEEFINELIEHEGDPTLHTWEYTSTENEEAGKITLTNDKFSLADVNVTETVGGMPIEKMIGPGLLGRPDYQEEEKEKKRNEKKNANRRKRRGKRTATAMILQDAISTLFPKVEDPGEALRLARAAVKEGGGDLFAGESSSSVGPGREKIGPGNNHDDLPVFVMAIVDYIIIPELEKAKYAVAQRKGDSTYITVSNENYMKNLRWRKNLGVGCAQPINILSQDVGHPESLRSYPIIFSNDKEPSS